MDLLPATCCTLYPKTSSSEHFILSANWWVGKIQSTVPWLASTDLLSQKSGNFCKAARFELAMPSSRNCWLLSRTSHVRHIPRIDGRTAAQLGLDKEYMRPNFAYWGCEGGSQLLWQRRTCAPRFCPPLLLAYGQGERLHLLLTEDYSWGLCGLMGLSFSLVLSFKSASSQIGSRLLWLDCLVQSLHFSFRCLLVLAWSCWPQEPLLAATKAARGLSFILTVVFL